MSKYRNLLAQKAALEKTIARTRKREIGKIIKDINALIQEYDLSPSDLRFPTIPRAAKTKQGPVKAPIKTRKTKATVAPQYRDPETGATWSGRGRAPAWIVGDKQNYRISNEQDKQHSGEESASSESIE